MKTRAPVQLSLTLLSDVIEEFVSTVGATLTGNALVPIFGIGDEEDNWEALHHFLSSQDGRRVGTKTRLLQLLHQRIQTQIDLMCQPVLSQAALDIHLGNSHIDVKHARPDQGSDEGTPPVGTLSHSECQALAMGMVFLAEHIVRQEKARWIGKAEGLRVLEHLRAWSRKGLYAYCLTQIEKGNLRFQHTPAELLPALANRFYRKSLVPWLLKSISPHSR